MSTAVADAPAEPAADAVPPDRNPRVRRVLLAVLALLVLVAAAFAGSAAFSPRTPLDGSADAGFARDMAAHHEQAVEMSEIVRDRTRDDTIRVIATDVALTQTAQIGMMQGWLTLWRLPIATPCPRARGRPPSTPSAGRGWRG